MNVVELIRADHAAVEDMFDKYHDLAAPDKRHLAEKICDELDKHASAEEEKVYQHIDAELREHSIEEHDQIRAACEKIKSGQGDLDTHVAELEQAVTHHVQEEEENLLPQLEQRDEAVLDSLGKEFEEAKK